MRKLFPLAGVIGATVATLSVSSLTSRAIKINGQWFFSKRRIYDEQRKERAYPGTTNPAW